MPQPASFCPFWFASLSIDEPGCWQSARKLPGWNFGESGTGNPVFQASWKLLWPPVAQGHHMGSDKSKGEIKDITAPPGSAKTTPKNVVQKQLR